jgi:hypothetical protein
MNKCSCDQNASAEMLGAKEKRWWNAQSWEMKYEHWEGTSSPRYEHNDKKTSDMQG